MNWEFSEVSGDGVDRGCEMIGRGGRTGRLEVTESTLLGEAAGETAFRKLTTLPLLQMLPIFLSTLSPDTGF